MAKIDKLITRSQNTMFVSYCRCFEDIYKFDIFAIMCIKSKVKYSFRPDFTTKLVYGLAFGTTKFYIVPYDKINHGLINLNCHCDVKSDLRALIYICKLAIAAMFVFGLYKSG